MKPYTQRDDFQPRVVGKVNAVCGVLCLWVHAVVKYYEVAQAVEPKKILEDANEKLAKDTNVLKARENELRRVNQSIQDLETKMKQMKNKKNSLMSKLEHMIKNKESDSTTQGKRIFKKETYENGSVYVGEFSGAMRHGHGKYTYRNGSVYEGEWHNDYWHGRGKYTYSNGTVWHDGMWDYNIPVEEIEPPDSKTAGTTLTAPDGTQFEYSGGLKDGKPHGRGTAKLSNGGYYDGGWKDGQRHGVCDEYRTEYYTLGGYTFEGGYKDNKKHGWGKVVAIVEQRPLYKGIFEFGEDYLIYIYIL